MIVAQRKPLEEISRMVKNYKKILIVGCGECVTVCHSGGEKEVSILASELKILRNKEENSIQVEEITIRRQCEPEFVEEISEKYKSVDAVISMACGVGVQGISDKIPEKEVLPALDTTFYGGVLKPGVWVEKCGGCGICVLDKTGDICPIVRCSKSLLNGPCGGSEGGKCEVSKDIDCAWQLIYDRLKLRGKLDILDEIVPIRDWRPAGHGGPRKMVREDLM